MNNELMNLSEVCATLRLSRSTIYRLIARGDFPPPVRISGSSRVLWPRSMVRGVVEAAIKTSQSQFELGREEWD